jgi:hypothetical protein
VNRYKVTGPRPVLDHAPDEEFEADLNADVEADLVAGGRIEILPQDYQVVGTSRVHATEPGGIFSAALTVAQEAALIEGGHIERHITKPKRATKKEA